MPLLIILVIDHTILGEIIAHTVINGIDIIDKVCFCSGVNTQHEESEYR